MAVTLEDIAEAAARLEEILEPTPLLRPAALERLLGVPVALKAENLQRTGSFKIRGAYNRLATLSQQERTRGVLAASAGNHAQGVALAASLLGLKATIVMPEGAPLTKVVATRSFGARVILAGSDLGEAFETAREIKSSEGLTFIHPFDDPAIIAGQGTVGLEIADEAPEIETLLVPIGGGGLISGTALALKSRHPDIRIIGVESVAAPGAYRAREEGRRVELTTGRSIADGLAVKSLSERTYAMVEELVDDLVVVEEDEIARAILVFLERLRLVVEGAGAVGLAALLTGRVKVSGPVGIVVSGGNIDVNILSRIIDRGLVAEGRYLRLQTKLRDQPGALDALLGIVAAERVNVISVEHDRLQPGVELGETQVEITLETRDRAHAEQLLARLKAGGYQAREI